MLKKSLLAITGLLLISHGSNAEVSGGSRKDLIQLRISVQKDGHKKVLVCQSDGYRKFSIYYYSSWGVSPVLEKLLAIPEDVVRAPELATLLNQCNSSKEEALRTGTNLVYLNIKTGETSPVEVPNAVNLKL